MDDTKAISGRTYADEMERIVAQYRYCEFTVVYIPTERMSVIDIVPGDLEEGYDFRYSTRRVRESRLVKQLAAALRRSHFVRLSAQEVDSTSLDVRYGVLLTSKEGSKEGPRFSLYLTGPNEYGYVNGVAVSVQGEVGNWLAGFCRQTLVL